MSETTEPAAPPDSLVRFAEVLRERLPVLVAADREKERVPFLCSLAPRDEDYARVFEPAKAEKARSFYESMWKRTPSVVWNPRHTVIRFQVALSDDFLTSHPRAAAFPKGFRDIANELAKGLPWAVFDLLEAGETLGLSTDGLVFLDNRLLWFPRPYVAVG